MSQTKKTHFFQNDRVTRIRVCEVNLKFSVSEFRSLTQRSSGLRFLAIVLTYVLCLSRVCVP